MSTRDDFTNKTKEILAKRVGYHCSKPSCRIITTGPHEKKEKSTNIGVAAHITAAAPGGPRFDKNLTSEERKDIANGIWLCLTCSSIIDKDPVRFSVELLNDWKNTSEKFARDIIDGNTTYIPPLVLKTLEEQLSHQASQIESKDQQLNELKEKYISLNKSLHERSTSSPLIDKALFALNTGDFLSAEILLLEDIEENNKKNAKSYYDIGKISELQVDYEKAIKYFTNAVNIDSTNDQYLNSLARVLYLTANYNEAVLYYKKNLTIYINKVGENHKDTAFCYNNIGLIYHAIGNYDDAITYCMKALNINLDVLNPNHPSIAANYNALAAAYQFQEKYEKAIDYSKKGLKIISSILGDKHIDTATCYNNLGAIYYSNGDNDEAIKNHTKALELYI